MRLRIVCVGKPRDRTLAEVHDGYASRIERFGVRYEAKWVPEVRPDGRYSDDHVREREARALLQMLDDRGTVVALDRSGDSFDTDALARQMESWATPLATFLVGGPLGLHVSLLEHADRCWSLSPLTFPHELARVILAEQLYRALTILRGVPYHK